MILMLSLKSHKEICCKPGCRCPGIQKRACLFPKQPFAADKLRAKGNIWCGMATERVGELGNAAGAAQPGLSYDSAGKGCQAAVCDPSDLSRVGSWWGSEESQQNIQFRNDCVPISH